MLGRTPQIGRRKNNKRSKNNQNNELEKIILMKINLCLNDIHHPPSKVRSISTHRNKHDGKRGNKKKEDKKRKNTENPKQNNQRTVLNADEYAKRSNTKNDGKLKYRNAQRNRLCKDSAKMDKSIRNTRRKRDGNQP